MNTYVIVIFVLLLLLLLTLACGCMKKDLVPYEGFSGKVKEGNTNPLDTSSNDVDASSKDVDASSKDVDASSKDVDASSNVLESSSNDVEASSNVDVDAKEGFATLGYANIDNISQIDTFSTVNGSMNCLTQSSNLTNSMGPLCLSKEQQMALQTRGGNASCPPM